MHSSAVLALVWAAALAAANAQKSVENPNFPFCKCIKGPSAYSLSSTVKSLGGGKYCFYINAKPPAACSSYCCKSDLKKIEFNVHRSCRVPVADVRATLNGVPTKVKPNFDFVQLGPPNATILKLTQLGLGLASDGTELCIFLGSRQPGVGCTTLEQLCVPPKGMPAGVCSAALFDSENDCCPISTVGVPSSPAMSQSPPPPPPGNPFTPSALRPPETPTMPAPSPPPPTLPEQSPPPPETPSVPLPPSPHLPPPMHPEQSPPPPETPLAPLPPSPPSPSPCVFCAYIALLVTGDVRAPISLEPRCAALAAKMADDITSEAATIGAELVSEPSLTSCQTESVKVCGEFASSDDGARMQTWADQQVNTWISLITDDAPDCPAYLNGYTVSATIAGDGDPANSFLDANAGRDCAPQPIPFPSCACDTRQRATVFSAEPFMFRLPGRRPSRTLYCFTTITTEPLDPESACGKSFNLLKAEIWADETQRRLVKGIGVQPGGSENMTFRAPSWGGNGEDTLKVTPLNWGIEEATGGRICFEVESTTDISSLCKTGSNTCWINFFNQDRKCCPLYPATLVG